MKAKSIKSPDRQGTLPVSNFIPSLTSNSLTNGHMTNTNGSILGREMCTSPVSSINTIQSPISSGAQIQSLTPKDAPSPFQVAENNSIHENMSPSSTSTASPFIRSSSSNSNSSLNLSANCNNGSVHQAMSTIIHPIDSIQGDEGKEPEASIALKYSMSSSPVGDTKEEHNEVTWINDVCKSYSPQNIFCVIVWLYDVWQNCFYQNRFPNNVWGLIKVIWPSQPIMKLPIPKTPIIILSLLKILVLITKVTMTLKIWRTRKIFSMIGLYKNRLIWNIRRKIFQVLRMIFLLFHSFLKDFALF